MKLDKATRRDRKISRRRKAKIGEELDHWNRVIERRKDIKIKDKRKEKASRVGNEQ